LALQQFVPVFKDFGEALVDMKDISFGMLAGIAGGITLIGLALAGFGLIAVAFGPALVIGAVGILIMAAALYVLALAFQQFVPVFKGFSEALVDIKDISFGMLAGIAGGITLIGLALASFGLIGTALVIGAAGILIMAAALYVLALAIQQFVPVFKGFSETLVDMKDISFGMLAGIAGGIVLIGLALASFGLTGIFGAIGLVMLMATTAALTQLSSLGPGLSDVASALESIKASLENGFSLGGITDVPDEINIPTIVSAQIADAIITSNSILGEKLDAVRAAIENQDNNTYLDGAKMNKGMGKNVQTAKVS